MQLRVEAPFGAVGGMMRPTLRSRCAAPCAAAALAAAVLTGCAEREPVADVQVQWTIEPSPPREGPVRIEFALAGDGALAGAEVEVEGGMNHAGMVPEIAAADDLGAGRYAAELELTMGGDWFLVFRGTLADGRAFERTELLPQVQPR